MSVENMAALLPHTLKSKGKKQFLECLRIDDSEFALFPRLCVANQVIL
jgi:hypothetical protein